MSSKLPAFRTLADRSNAPEGPEQLFYKLGGRAKSHGYLRGPQQDVLRDFSDKFSNSADLALELPTGTGKTMIGLLIAEWRRLSGQKVAFLCLTNQLASQVIEEGKRLGITCADLRGTKDTRDVGEEGKYRTRAAVAVTTYSNLFNVNPVIRDANLLIFDDAHSGEQFVSNMWTVSITISGTPTRNFSRMYLMHYRRRCRTRSLRRCSMTQRLSAWWIKPTSSIIQNASSVLKRF